MLCASFVLLCNNSRINAQLAVWDPGNFTQSIINAGKQVVEASTTAQNMISNFKETVKIYEQGKQYYDGLKAVSNLVKDARKVQKSILLAGEVSDMYVVNFQKMLSDPNYSVEELNAIAAGYVKLLEQSNDVVNELKGVVNVSTLSLTDKDRMEVVDRCYEEMVNYRNLVKYYTNKNIGVSYLRAKKKGETARVAALYGNPDARYW
jgi:hypothetical protein